jgi:hypothetical protein
MITPLADLGLLDRGYAEPRRISLPRLSEKSLEGTRRVRVEGTKDEKRRFCFRFDHSWEPTRQLIRYFQTVSPRTWVNEGKKKGRSCYIPTLLAQRPKNGVCRLVDPHANPISTPQLTPCPYPIRR